MGVNYFCRESKTGCFEEDKRFWRNELDKLPLSQQNIYLLRLTKEEDPTDGVILSRGILPCLRNSHMKSEDDMSWLRLQLRIKLIKGHFDKRYKCYSDARRSMGKCMTGPIWVQPHTLTQAYKKAHLRLDETDRIRIYNQEDIAACYIFFNQVHLLDKELQEVAGKIAAKDPRHFGTPGEITLFKYNMKVFHDLYLTNSPLGVD